MWCIRVYQMTFKSKIHNERIVNKCEPFNFRSRKMYTFIYTSIIYIINLKEMCPIGQNKKDNLNK